MRTRVTPRPDVVAYIKKTELNNSGYTTVADISNLNGQCILGLSIKQNNKLNICPQFKIPTTITK